MTNIFSGVEYPDSDKNDPDNGEFTFAEDGPSFMSLKTGDMPVEVSNWIFKNPQWSIAKLQEGKSLDLE